MPVFLNERSSVAAGRARGPLSAETNADQGHEPSAVKSTFAARARWMPASRSARRAITAPRSGMPTGDRNPLARGYEAGREPCIGIRDLRGGDDSRGDNGGDMTQEANEERRDQQPQPGRLTAEQDQRRGELPCTSNAARRTGRAPRRAIIRPATTPAATEARPGTPKIRPAVAAAAAAHPGGRASSGKRARLPSKRWSAPQDCPREQTDGPASQSRPMVRVARRSIQKNSARRITPASNAGRDRSMIPKTRAKSPSVTDAAPGTSSRTRSGERPAGTTKGVSARIMIAKGTLMRKAQRQLSMPTSVPPTRAPTVKPPESSVPFQPST